MNIYVYSDESGVFDKNHNDYFVYGGIICLSRDEKDNLTRSYLQVEKVLREIKNIDATFELKASKLTTKEKGKVFRSLNHCHKFCIIINLKSVLQNIYSDKKSKQRYLDYAYKIGLKKALLNLCNKGLIDPLKVNEIHVFCDEHKTATNGRYELESSLEQEFKIGTYNLSFDIFYEPVFPNVKKVTVKYCDSKTIPLIRSADIVANKVYFSATNNKIKQIRKKIFVCVLP